MIIREAELNDRAAIYDVVLAAFGGPGEAKLVDQLRADGDSVISLIAVDHASIVGHVMLSKMNAPFKALGLAPVSVRPDCQKSGVGSSLVREALLRARQAGWEAVFVLGAPRFYRRFGFDPEPASRFHLSLRWPAPHGPSPERRALRYDGKDRLRFSVCSPSISAAAGPPLAGGASRDCPLRDRNVWNGVPGMALIVVRQVRTRPIAPLRHNNAPERRRLVSVTGGMGRERRSRREFRAPALPPYPEIAFST